MIIWFCRNWLPKIDSVRDVVPVSRYKVSPETDSSLSRNNVSPRRLYWNSLPSVIESRLLQYKVFPVRKLPLNFRLLNNNFKQNNINLSVSVVGRSKFLDLGIRNRPKFLGLVTCNRPKLFNLGTCNPQSFSAIDTFRNLDSPLPTWGDY